jgi:phospholipid/cholesterol/gamma-HCH transport system substrate-binding protein
MRRSPTRDLLVGFFVLVGLAAVAYLSFRVGGLGYGGPGGLPLWARFDQTGGLKARAPVVLAGVKVGQVESISLSEDYRARVDMDVDARLKLPVDTTASIVTAGLLGDRYISLQLGGEEEVLKPGEEIGFTESAVILERLIGKFVTGGGAGGAPAANETGDAAP